MGASEKTMEVPKREPLLDHGGAQMAASEKIMEDLGTTARHTEAPQREPSEKFTEVPKGELPRR